MPTDLEESRRIGRTTPMVRVRADPEVAEARRLFREYADEIDVRFEGFANELANLPGDYGPPTGELLLVTVGGRVVGCAAVRALEPGICELKRLFLEAPHRGQGIGRQLVEAILEEARRLGYAKIRLDTLPSMQDAIALYRVLGFEEIPPYRSQPIEGARFMERPL